MMMRPQFAKVLGTEKAKKKPGRKPPESTKIDTDTPKPPSAVKSTQVDKDEEDFGVSDSVPMASTKKRKMQKGVV